MTGNSHFQDWLINSYKGGIVAINGLGPITANWGYIDSVTSDGAGGALWLNIVWVNGVKPTSGTIDIAAAAGRRLFMESTCSFTGALSYADAKFAKQTATPFGASWDFPSGAPVFTQAAGMGKAQSQGTAVATVTGGNIISAASLSLSVSKGQGQLTNLSAGGITFTFVSVTGTFP